MTDDDLELKLAALAGGTDGLRPAPGFEARVMAALPGTSSRGSWDESVLRFGKTMLVVAAVCAAGFTALGIRTQSAQTDDDATAYGMEELDW